MPIIAQKVVRVKLFKTVEYTTLVGFIYSRSEGFSEIELSFSYPEGKEYNMLHPCVNVRMRGFGLTFFNPLTGNVEPMLKY